MGERAVQLMEDNLYLREQIRGLVAVGGRLANCCHNAANAGGFPDHATGSPPDEVVVVLRGAVRNWDAVVAAALGIPPPEPGTVVPAPGNRPMPGMTPPPPAPGSSTGYVVMWRPGDVGRWVQIGEADTYRAAVRISCDHRGDGGDYWITTGKPTGALGDCYPHNVVTAPSAISVAPAPETG